jgi:heme-degrading monooxygenase HmoA
MALLGKAALAMWWDIAPEVRAEFEHWHSHEHFPERLGVPGFLRASRWRAADGGEGFFVVYELATHEVLGSPRYLERLNAPSPWSRQLMPHHRHMVRCQCHVLESQGGHPAGHALTVRLSPRPGAEDTLRATLKARLRHWVTQPGVVGAHLLRHDAPAIATTTEQQIRGGDRVADWILVVTGYDGAALDALAAGEAGPAGLAALGAQDGATPARFTLSYSALSADVADAAG